jgi:hypothetical protein
MTVKDELHELVDQLDEDAAIEALAYLQSLSLPASLRTAARDEPESDDDWAAVAEVEDLELAELPSRRPVEVQEPED